MTRRDLWPGDARSLEDDLRRSVRGEVRFDSGSRALYATDASNYRQVPIGVVSPVDPEDVIAAVAACRRHGAPIVHRGAGTSLAGPGCNAAGGRGPPPPPTRGVGGRPPAGAPR